MEQTLFAQRQKAQAEGLSFFFTGKPCRHGHVADRYAKDGKCVVCMRNRLAKRRQADPEAHRRRNKESRDRVAKRNGCSYAKVKHQNNPQERLHCNLNRLVRRKLTKQGASKSNTTCELLGCTVAYAYAWLEIQFQSGMTWDNYGDWHIDHIRPCASFDLTDPEQQRQCFHYSNLQPLWAKDNLSKSDKWDEAA